MMVKTFRVTGPLSGEELLRTKPWEVVRIADPWGGEAKPYRVELCDKLQPCDCPLCEEHRS